MDWATYWRLDLGGRFVMGRCDWRLYGVLSVAEILGRTPNVHRAPDSFMRKLSIRWGAESLLLLGDLPFKSAEDNR